MQANPNAGKSRAVGAGHKKPAEEAADKAEEQTNSEAAESAGNAAVTEMAFMKHHPAATLGYVNDVLGPAN